MVLLVRYPGHEHVPDHPIVHYSSQGPNTDPILVALPECQTKSTVFRLFYILAFYSEPKAVGCVRLRPQMREFYAMKYDQSIWCLAGG